MREKFFILIAALIFVLWLSGGCSRDENNEKSAWIMSKTPQSEETVSVNSVLHGENSVENVENSLKQAKSAVENYTSNTKTEVESSEKHSFVTDSEESIENNIQEIQYIDGVPHIQAVMPSLIKFISNDGCHFSDIQGRYEESDIVLLGKITEYKTNEYYSRAKASPSAEDYISVSDNVPVTVKIEEVFKDVHGYAQDILSITFITYGCQMTLEEYKSLIDDNFPTELYPENTIVDCNIEGMGNIPYREDLCIFFLTQADENISREYFNGHEYSVYDLTGTTYTVKGENVFFGETDFGNTEAFLEKLRKLSTKTAANVEK